MPNQKISELTAIVTVDTSLDVLPIVDTSANTTKKISPTALKTALALDNVNNTSDANKPVSTAQQDALNAKVASNAAIVAATKTKITYDAKGLVTAGNVLDAADMPTGINAANIGTGVVSSTEFGYLDGVTSAIQTQLDAKQATLVSATNIKTINSTSLLGAGDISISASPSGVAGAIQFSNGSAFASDAANFFWDNTNKRLGVGTNAPVKKLNIVGGDVQIGNSLTSGNFNPATYRTFTIGSDFGSGALQIGNGTTGLMWGGLYANINNVSVYANSRDLTFETPVEAMRITSARNVGIGETTPTARLQVKGSGSTSATTSLLVQNSAGTTALSIKDDLRADFNGFVVFNGNMTTLSSFIVQGGVFGNNYQIDTTGATTLGVQAAANASALLDIRSTTRGFLPPRMTTTQKNAIVTPAAGLQVYDTTLNQMSYYNGSSWVNF